MPLFGVVSEFSFLFCKCLPLTLLRVPQSVDSFDICKKMLTIFCKCFWWLLWWELFKILTFFANACFDWVVISGEDGSPLAVGGFHQTLGRQVVFSLSHFFANSVSKKQEVFLCLRDISFLFPGREQSSWLLCLTVRRRTSIRWGTIFPTFCNLDNFFHYSYWIGEFFVNFSISIE